MAETAGSVSGLSALDWVVLVAATVALCLLGVWIYQGKRAAPPTPED